MQRAERLPFEPIDGIAGRMPLRYRRGSQMVAPVVIMALGTRKVELALSKLEDFPAGFDKGTASRIVGDGDWLSLRLMRHVSG